MRGQDSEIVSLQWTLIELPPQSPPSPKPPMQKVDLMQSLIADTKNVPSSSKVQDTKTGSVAAKSPIYNKTARKVDARREPPKPIVDATDMFDIHSFDYLEEEFGTISSASRRNGTRGQPDGDDNDKPEDHDKSTTNNEKFNFIEECQNLRDQIRAGGNGGDSDDDRDDNETNNNNSDFDDSCARDGIKRNQVAVNMSDIQNMMKNRSPIADGSIAVSDNNDSANMELCEIDELSNRSTIGSSHNTVEIAELEDVIKNLNINDATLTEASNGSVYLASGGQESCIVIWDVENGSIADKIQLKCQGRVKIPSKRSSVILNLFITFIELASKLMFLIIQSQIVRLLGFVQMN